MNKEQLRRLIAAGRTEEAIEVLLTLTRNTRLEGDIVQLSARFQKYKKAETLGTESSQNLSIQLNQVNKGLLDLIDDLPEPLGTGNAFPSSFSPPPDLPPPASAGSDGSPSKSVWIGVISLAAILAAILFVPCPTSAQFFVFRLILALGAAGIGSILPGFLNIESGAAKAGGALGLFALVYLLNPATLVGDERCKQEPFTLTVSVRAQKPSPNYPDLNNAELWLWNRNDWEKRPLSAEGVADFKNLSPDMTGVRVPVQLKAFFYRLAADSLTIQPPSAAIAAAPDGSLGQVSGSVQDAKGHFLSGVIVRVEGIADTTDAFGLFQLSIPPERQKEKYRLIATKTGYIPWENFFSPTAGQDAPIVLTKSKK